SSMWSLRLIICSGYTLHVGNVITTFNLPVYNTNYRPFISVSLQFLKDVKEEVKSEGVEQTEYDKIKQETFTPSEEAELKQLQLESLHFHWKTHINVVHFTLSVTSDAVKDGIKNVDIKEHIIEHLLHFK
ncbi:hypothetical protein L9F63_019102, partial [Diploptera punctata]